MLMNITNRLEELFEQIEMLPADKVEAAEKVLNFTQCFAQISQYFVDRLCGFFYTVLHHS